MVRANYAFRLYHICYPNNWNDGFDSLLDGYYHPHGPVGSRDNCLDIEEVNNKYAQIQIEHQLDADGKITIGILFEPVEPVVGVKFMAWFQVNGLKFGETQYSGVCGIDRFVLNTDFDESVYNILYDSKIYHVSVSFEDVIFTKL